MTDRELLQQALNAVEKISMGGSPDWADDVIPVIRTRLAQPDGVEGEVRVQIRIRDRWIREPQLEAAIATGWVHYEPPKKEWVGLTKEEKFELINEWNIGDAAIGDLCALIEAKLKEKNAT